MVRDPRVLLWDAHEAAAAVARFIAGRSREEYLSDEMLRSAVERQCGILGEALGRLRGIAPDLAERIPELRKAVAFRNLLIHGYATVDHAVVWRTVTGDLPALAVQLRGLLDELGPPTPPQAAP